MGDFGHEGDLVRRKKLFDDDGGEGRVVLDEEQAHLCSLASA